MLNQWKGARILLIYLEPTDYVLGLIERLRDAWPGSLDVWFVGQNLSQAWNLALLDPGMSIMPRTRWAKVRWYLQHLRSERFTLVHLAGWGHPCLLAALLVARWRGLPVAVESDTQLANTPLMWRTRIKRLLHPLLFRLPTIFLPGGQRQAAYLRHYGVTDDRIRIAQMTVDVMAITQYLAGLDPVRLLLLREQFKLPHEGVVFLYVGRLEPYKGVTDLLAAFGRLKAQVSDAILLIVGDGSLRDTVALAVKVQPGILATGRLQGTELLNAYAVSDALILPSHSEPWGLVVNEAMTAGLPVVVTDVVGCIDDLVIEGQTGWVVPAADPRALGTAMQRLAEDPEGRRRLGERARAHISGWTLENEADKVMQAWRMVQGAC